MDASAESELRERLREYAKEAQTVSDRAKEALDHLDQGDPAAAFRVIATAHSLDSYYDGLLQAFRSAGIDSDSVPE